MKHRYLNTYRSAGGWAAFYRRGPYRVRLRHEDGTPIDPEAKPNAVGPAMDREHETYEALHVRHQAVAAGVKPVRPQSIADLIRRYRASPEWEEKADETRRDYEKALKPLEADWGHLLAVGIRRHHVTLIRDRYARRVLRDKAGKPVLDERGRERIVPNARQANRVVTVLSVLLSYAMDPLGWRPDNPALRPKRLRAKGDDYRAWTQEEFAQFWDRSGPEWRFAALLALLTAQRGQDQVALRWSAYRGDEIYVVQQKGRERVKLWLWCPPMLAAELDQRRPAQSGEEAAASTILIGPDGKAWKVNAFQKAAGQAIRAAGLSGIVWHGLRATAASWAADGGASEKQLQSLLGHLTGEMSRKYARGAEQRRLARSAAEGIIVPIGNATGTRD